MKSYQARPRKFLRIFRSQSDHGLAALGLPKAKTYQNKVNYGCLRHFRKPHFGTGERRPHLFRLAMAIDPQRCETREGSFENRLFQILAPFAANLFHSPAALGPTGEKVAQNYGGFRQNAVFSKMKAVTMHRPTATQNDWG